jgi:hypothetical protein
MACGKQKTQTASVQRGQLARRLALEATKQNQAE